MTFTIDKTINYDGLCDIAHHFAFEKRYEPTAIILHPETIYNILKTLYTSSFNYDVSSNVDDKNIILLGFKIKMYRSYDIEVDEIEML